MADAAQSLEALLKAVKRDGVSVQKDATARVECAIQQRLAELSPLERQHLALCGAIRAGLPEDAVIIGDMTQAFLLGLVCLAGRAAGELASPRGFLHPRLCDTDGDWGENRSAGASRDRVGR